MSATGEQEPIDLGRRVASGAGWMVLFKAMDRGVGLVSTVILARLLVPADFGLVAIAMSVVALFEMMSAFGFDSALIQRQDVSRKHYDTAWTFNVIFGCTIAVFLLLVAVPAADFYEEARLRLILPALAVGALVGGFANIGTVAFRKELDFNLEFIFLFSKRMAAFVVTMTLAYTFRSYWALVGGIVAGKLLSVAISYRLHPYRPRFCLQGSRDLLNFSKWLFISNFLLFLHAKADSFILGRTVGVHSLGIYNIATEIAVIPSTDMIAPINRAVYPAYSKLAVDLENFRKRFVTVFGTIALIAVPASVGLACVAENAVLVLLGDQWVEAVPILTLFTVAGLASALQSNLYLGVMALGKPKANTIINAILTSISLPLIVTASIRYGVLGAAWVHLALSICLYLSLSVVFLRLTGLALGRYVNALWRPAVAAGIMAIALFAVDSVDLGRNISPILMLALRILLGAATYSISIFVLWGMCGRPEESPESALLGLARNRVSGLSQRLSTR